MMPEDDLEFSIVIPTYNEGERLPSFLPGLNAEVKKSGYRVEVIIVDDGSHENHHRVYLELLRTMPDTKIRLIRHSKNIGKGAALRTGFAASNGTWIGYVDADGSTPAQEVIRLLKVAASSNSLDGVFASRIRMLGYETKRLLKRHLFGRLFVTWAYLCLGVPIYDPQCGCKFFRKEKILPLLDLCQEQGYLFDIELVALGYFHKLNFLEVPINWQDVAGSKVRIMWDGLKMAIRLLKIRQRLVRHGLLTKKPHLAI